jgi:hypothetical protein
MGIFQTHVKIFNRAPVALNVMFDGQQKGLPAGESELPDLTVPYAQNQNPIMGSQDPNNPTWSGARYLIVTADDEFFGKPLTKEEWEAHKGRPCRFDEEAAFAEKYGDDPKAKLVVRGKKGSATAGNRYEAGGTVQGSAVFTGRDA